LDISIAKIDIFTGIFDKVRKWYRQASKDLPLARARRPQMSTATHFQNHAMQEQHTDGNRLFVGRAPQGCVR
jgi:hypothetical protein